MARFLKDRELRSSSYSIRMPIGPTSLRPTAPVDGLFRFNSDTNRFEVYYESKWNSVARAGVSTITKDSFTGDGFESYYNMSKIYTAGQEAQVIAVVGNIFQNPGVAYTFDTSVPGVTKIVFTSPPPLGQPIIVLHGYTSTEAS